MPTHTIGLRGPWTLLGEGTAATRVLLPASPAAWGTPDAAVVTVERQFTRPTGLVPSDRLRLVIDGTQLRGRWELNGCPLGEFDLTAQRTASDWFPPDLPARNRLRLQLHPFEAASEFRGVVLEIASRDDA
jgi:hypothetical protein